MATLTTDVQGGVFAHEHARILDGLRRGAGELPALGETYAPEVVAAVATVWRARMVNEHRSSAVFAGLLPQLIDASVTLDAQTVVLRMASDEIHHAALCGHVLAAFGETPRAVVPDRVDPMPAHADVSPLERVTRNVLVVGCLAETVAVALLSEERARSTDPLVRAVLDQILADEVTHARFGWSFLAHALASLHTDARATLDRYLRVAFASLERHELDRLVPAGPMRGELKAQRESLGVCDGTDGREVFYATVDQVIVPRLEAFGLGARDAWKHRLAV